MDAKRLRDIAFEADYWREILHDLMELNDLIVRAANAQAGVPINLLLPLALTPRDDARRDLTRASEASAETMRLLSTMGEQLAGLVGLAAGRIAHISQSADEAGA
jgi:hypothetical protein